VKTLTRLAVGFLVAASMAVTAAAMVLHGMGMYDEGDQVVCQAWLEHAPDAVWRAATVWLYGPSGEFLSAQALGQFGYYVLVDTRHPKVGSGTYTCDAEFWQEDQRPGGETEYDYQSASIYIP